MAKRKTPADGYLVKVVSRVTGIPVSTIDFWARTGFITPSISDGKRSQRGGYVARVYSFRDLVALRAAERLRQAGVSLQALRKVGDYLHEYGGSFADTYLLAMGDDIYIAHGEEALISAMRHPGQMAAIALVCDLARTEAEVIEAIQSLAVAA